MLRSSGLLITTSTATHKNHVRIHLLSLFTSLIVFTQFNVLRLNKLKFLSKSLVKNYLGFIRGQLTQITTKPDANKKKIYNALRLATEAQRVVCGNEPVMYYHSDHPTRTMIMECRKNENNYEEYVSVVRDILVKIEEEEPWDLPAVDKDWLNNWIVTLRTKLYNQTAVSQ